MMVIASLALKFSIQLNLFTELSYEYKLQALLSIVLDLIESTCVTF